MRMRHLLSVLGLGVILLGCSSAPPEDMLATAVQEEALARQAADTVLEASARARLFEPAVAAYEKLLEAHPNSPQAQEGMFRLATIYNNDVRDFPKAVAMYRSYAERFPEGEKAAVAMFLIGYVYNNELRMLDSAKVAYERFLKTYPNHEMAISAQFELNTLGKPPEELVPKDEEPTSNVAQGRGRP
jgi:outer membrane protein assembly factor BamD (BamD/ComL family)